MNWEELTCPEFAEAVKRVGGVCLVPWGVLEKHGNHLPVGTDVIVARDVARRAAAIEPAVVFPTLYFGQISEGKHWPGAVALPHRLMFDLLEGVCEEIARNGFKKIILLNGHGGNEGLLGVFAQSTLDRPRDYMVYPLRLANYMGPVNADPAYKKQMVSSFDMHGGETETSTVLAVNQKLVKMDAITNDGLPTGRLAQLPVYTGISWYAEYPNHYAGEPAAATVEKGEFLMTGYARNVARIIQAVKADAMAPKLVQEFYSRGKH